MNGPVGKSAVERYFEAVCGILEEIKGTQKNAISEAVNAITDSLLSDGVLHLFGTGHAHMLAEEAYSRAGGLAPVDAILELSLMPHSGISTAL